jgi:hypothetical protein
MVEGRYWCNIIVLNAPASCKLKSCDTDNFSDKLGNVFSQFLEHHTNIFLAELNSKLGREDMFKSRVWN